MNTQTLEYIEARKFAFRGTDKRFKSKNIVGIDSPFEKILQHLKNEGIAIRVTLSTASRDPLVYSDIYQIDNTSVTFNYFVDYRTKLSEEKGWIIIYGCPLEIPKTKSLLEECIRIELNELQEIKT